MITSTALPTFPVYRLRFRYQAMKHGTLPWNCGSIIRGTLGKAMHDLFCMDKKTRCELCPYSEQCPYYFFYCNEFHSSNRYYKNVTKYPRTYLIEAPLNRSRLEPGDAFEFNLILLGDSIDKIRSWITAARFAGSLGFGRERLVMKLREISEANLFGKPGKPIVEIRANQEFLNPPKPIRFNEIQDQLSTDKDIRFVKITFLTHARILEKNKRIKQLRFYLLIQSILRRLSMLNNLLDPTSIWDPDFTQYGALADTISVYLDESQWHSRYRWSASQQKEIDIGGLKGQIVFRGYNLPAFLPILYLGSVVHVGKGTVFGNGRMEIEIK